MRLALTLAGAHSPTVAVKDARHGHTADASYPTVLTAEVRRSQSSGPSCPASRLFIPGALLRVSP